MRDGRGGMARFWALDGSGSGDQGSEWVGIGFDSDERGADRNKSSPRSFILSNHIEIFN